jgi:hypothetical protein
MPSPPTSHRHASEPAADIQPTNCVSDRRLNENIKKAYIIDPSIPDNAQGKTNLDLYTVNGNVDIHVAVVHAAGNSMANDRAKLKVETTSGNVTVKWHEPPAQFYPHDENGTVVRRPVDLAARTTNGAIRVEIPRSFVGIIEGATTNGKLRLSSELKRKMTPFRNGKFGTGGEVKGFIGECEGLSDVVAAVEREAANARNIEEDNAPQNGGGNVFIDSEGNAHIINGGNYPIPGRRTPFFEGASGFTISGTTFTTVGGNVNHTTTTTSTGNGNRIRQTIIATPARTRSPDNSAAVAFGKAWKGSRVVIHSVNGDVDVDYVDDCRSDDWWKREEAPRRSQTMHIPPMSFVSDGSGAIMTDGSGRTLFLGNFMSA